MSNKTLKEMRKQIVLCAVSGGGGHIASSFSSLEIIWSLYQGGVLNIDPNNPLSKNRDRFILSKGHAALALYVCLADIGFFKESELERFAKSKSFLGGEPFIDVPGVETITGSLGHGLPYSIGLALGLKKKKICNKVFVLLGDGECQEGSVWESAAIASALKLDNLTIIIDNNKIQKMAYVDDIYGNPNWGNKWKAFGYSVYEVNGHDTKELIRILSKKNEFNKPRVIIANTVKGKGVSFIENNINWHYKLPSKKEWKIISNELDISEKEIEYAKSIH